MAKLWIVAADASRARIFEANALGENPQEVADLLNPEGRAHNRDLISDAGGRYFSKGKQTQGHGTLEVDAPTQHAAELFAIRLAEELERAHAQQRYDRLTLVAPPKFLGLLREKLGKSTRRIIWDEIPKDIARLDPDRIAEHVRALRAEDAVAAVRPQEV